LRAGNEIFSEFLMGSIFSDFFFNLSLLSPAVVGMGMTTPLIVHIAKEELRNIGRTIGIFYGLNIFGAAIGAFVTGLVLIESIGLTGSTYLAALFNIIIGLVALALVNAEIACAGIVHGVADRVKRATFPCYRRSCGRGNDGKMDQRIGWVPAFAGMTVRECFGLGAAFRRLALPSFSRKREPIRWFAQTRRLTSGAGLVQYLLCSVAQIQLRSVALEAWYEPSNCPTLSHCDRTLPTPGHRSLHRIGLDRS